jgi:hypothetical protein
MFRIKTDCTHTLIGYIRGSLFPLIAKPTAVFQPWPHLLPELDRNRIECEGSGGFEGEPTVRLKEDGWSAETSEQRAGDLTRIRKGRVVSDRCGGSEAPLKKMQVNFDAEGVNWQPLDEIWGNAEDM